MLIYIKARLNSVRKRLIHSNINIVRKSPIIIVDRLTEKNLSIIICMKARSKADMIASMRKINPKKPKVRKTSKIGIP
jgi:hypothetical protein